MENQKTTTGLKYTEYRTLDLPATDKQILQFWKDGNIFGKSVSEREGAPRFTFYEGPPSANGKPGIHHVMARAIKDIFCRYKTLQGFQVKRKGGWDTHGLPVELQVEKRLGITKDDIGKTISVVDYNRECRKDVLEFKDLWDELTVKMGYWVDLDHPYVTFENNYIETVWSLLKKLYEKNYLYKGFTIQPYSPAAGTGLSSHELNYAGAYKPVKDVSAVAMFKVIREAKSEFLFSQAEEEVFFLAWTTTPWTLPANTALAVGKEIRYSRIRTFNPYTGAPQTIVMASDLKAKYFSADGEQAEMRFKPGDKLLPWRMAEECKGANLEGIRYEQLLPYVQPDSPAFRVLIGDFVSTEDGTGIVHIAPTFGSDDFRVAKQNGVPPLMVKDEEGNPMPLVDRRGRFVKEVTDFAGEYVKEAYLSEAEKAAETKKQGRDKYLSVDERIVIKLKKENRCFKSEKYEHSYPHCWRTDKPVLYYPLDSWFIKTTAAKDRMVELNKTINWKPESTGTGRFGNWLENLVDWNLSRSRYWGIPLPVWTSEEGEIKCIGSVEELRKEISKSVEKGWMKAADLEFWNGSFDLHRPYVDEVVLVSESGKPMRRESDLIDVWFDSGAMPYAQWHYPFENLDEFEKSFPADYIAEGVDQTRGWFFTLHAIAVMLFDSVAYKNVISNGLVLDKEGNKMSKSRGNTVDPFKTLEKYGADATRWYMVTNASPWDNLKFNEEGITEATRGFFGTLYNTYNFFALYANIDGFDFSEERIPVKDRPEIDRWILSMLHSLSKKVKDAMDDYDATPAGRMIETFVNDHLSNWYVRLCRRRFWKGEMNADKRSAYQTLYECLVSVAKLMSPIAPFFSDRLFCDLNAVTGREQAASVHLSLYPFAVEAEIDTELEARMELAQDITSLSHSIRKRKEVNIRLRQPLKKLLIPVLDKKQEARIAAVRDLILAETNVKELEFVGDDSGILVKKIKPNFRALGQRAGKHMKEITAQVAAFGQDEIRKIEKEGKIQIQVEAQPFDLALAEVDILSEDIPGWSVAGNGRVTVALDIVPDAALLQEGTAREFVNRIQNLRKDSGFEVTDKIRVTISANPVWDESVKNFLHYICAETLATDLQLSPNLSEGHEIEVNGVQGWISISR